MKVAYGAAFGKLLSERSNVLFSLMSGYNLYVLLDERTTVFRAEYPMVEHAITGERYYAVSLDDSPYGKPATSRTGDESHRWDLERWQTVLERPMPRDRFVWPVDVASAEDERCFLIFPLEFDMARLYPLADLMPNWNDGRPLASYGEEVARQRGLRVKVAKSLVDAWNLLHATGYLYLGFDPEHMYYSENGKVKLGFSLATVNVGSPDAIRPDAVAGSPVAARSYDTLGLSLDYVDPLAYQSVKAALEKGGMAYAGAYTDMFAMHAMVFRLLVGRLPFYGPIVLPEPNDSPEEHRRWLDFYQGNPVFIFDSQDDSNRVGGEDGFASDEVFEDNWNALDAGLRAELEGYFDSVKRIGRWER